MEQDTGLEEHEIDELNQLSTFEESSDDLPSEGLLSFYDRLRSRMSRFVQKKGGDLGPRAVDMFLLIPDVFVLLLRLALDKNVPRESRTLIGSAIAYFVLPIDLLPEAFAGPIGYSDDLFLAVAVLAQAFGKDLEPFAEKYWSGSSSLRTLVGDVLTAGNGLLGTDLHGRLRALLASKGVDLDSMDLDSADLDSSDLDSSDLDEGGAHEPSQGSEPVVY